jgi:hypothetical protein
MDFCVDLHTIQHCGEGTIRTPWPGIHPHYSHGNLMAHVEWDKTLSCKVSPDAFPLKESKGNESN